MNLIYGEILFGATDGINKVFTSQNTIDTVFALNIGGAPYTTFSVSGRIITLDDAPTESPVLDYYFLENTPTVTNSDYTVAEALVDFLDIVKIKQFNNVYKQSEAIRLISESYLNILNNNRDTSISGQYSFTKSASYKALSQYRGDIIPISGAFDNYTPRVGALLINGAFTSFTTRTDTNITLADGITFEVSTGDIILVGYKIPTSAVDLSFVSVDGVPYKKLSLNQFLGGRITGTYTIVDGYLFISEGQKADVVVQYTKRSKLLTETTDLISVEPSYQRIFSLYAGYTLLARAEDNRSAVVEKEYRSLKRQYIAYLKRHSKGANSNNNFSGPLNGL